MTVPDTSAPPNGELVDIIARDIREGVYHPRERLIEVDLVDRYGASRNAVRSALIELAAFGLVEREANRGARVRRVSIDEAIESTEVRLSLQAMCAAKAAARVTPADAKDLEELLPELRDAVAKGDRARNMAANSDISQVIRRISGHGTADRIIESLQNQTRFYWYQLPDRRVDSLREYETIVAAVIAGDVAAATAAAYTHRDHVVEALRGMQAGMASEA